MVGRIIRIEPSELEHSLRLSPEERLRQANAAFRLFHDIHRPFEKPFVRGFETCEELARFEEEESLPR